MCKADWCKDLGPKRYSLSDGEMIFILGQIDNASSATNILYVGIVGTWDAILRQDGYSGLTEYIKGGNTLDVMAIAIPNDQAEEIAERMRKRALAIGVSPIGAANILMDWIDKRPSVY